MKALPWIFGGFALLLGAWFVMSRLPAGGVRTSAPAPYVPPPANPYANPGYAAANPNSNAVEIAAIGAGAKVVSAAISSYFGGAEAV